MVVMMTYKSTDPSCNQLMAHMYMMAAFTNFAGNEVSFIFVVVTFCTEIQVLSEGFFCLLYIYIVTDIIISSVFSILIFFIGKKHLQCLGFISSLLVPSSGLLLLSGGIFLPGLTESFALVKLLQILSKISRSISH